MAGAGSVREGGRGPAVAGGLRLPEVLRVDGEALGLS